MPVVTTKEILDRAFADRYGVAAFNILDDLTIDAVLAAAEEERAPVILQTSVKTVRAYGRDRLISVFRAMARDTTVPVARAPRPLPVPRRDHRVPRRRLELRALRRPRARRRRQPRADHRGRRRGARARRARRGRDRGHRGRRGRHRLGRGVDAAEPRGGRRLHHEDRRRRLRPGDRQRARPVQVGTEARTTSASRTSWRPRTSRWPCTAAPACRPTSSATSSPAAAPRSTSPRRSRSRTCAPALEHLKDAEEKNKWDPPTLFAHQRAAVRRDRPRAHRAVRRLGTGLVTAPAA